MRAHNGKTLSWITVVFIAIGSTTANGFMIDIVPSKAPNGNTSPNFSGYNANALNSLENTLGSPIGDPNIDPTGYAPLPQMAAGVFAFNPTQMVTSPFASWNGQANPAAPFDNERGNLIHFGVRILGQGTQFTLHQLQFDADSTDPSDFFDSVTRNFSTDTYSEFIRGIDYGADNAKGGGDDTVLMNGEAGSILVDELIYVGTAVGAGAGSTGTNQERLDSTITFFNNQGIFSIFGTYTLFADSTHTPGTEIASGMAELRIPEPSSMLLLTAGVLVIASGRARTKHRT